MSDKHTFTTARWLLDPETAWATGVDPVAIDRVQSKHGVCYAVRQDGYCLGKKGWWALEPIPSERTEEWLAENRYQTFGEAAEAVDKHCRSGLGRFHGRIREESTT